MAAGKRPRFVDQIDDGKLIAAIRAAEQTTTGQIRVHLSSRAAHDIEQAARRRFARLKMSQTPGRNAVLIYLQPRTRKFYVLGDTGLDAHGGALLWQPVADGLAADLGEGRYTDGLTGAIARVGAILAEHFPRRAETEPDAGLGDEPTRD